MPTFTLTSTIDPTLNGFLSSIDIDNDNDIDIISSINSAEYITTFKNDGLGNFTFYEATSYYCGNLQNPSFVNSAQQATTSGADILGATQMGYNAQMGDFNAKQAAQQNLNSGLMGLGGAAMMAF